MLKFAYAVKTFILSLFTKLPPLYIFLDLLPIDYYFKIVKDLKDRLIYNDINMKILYYKNHMNWHLHKKYLLEDYYYQFTSNCY